MPSRNIPLNHRNVTGYKSSLKSVSQHVESTLEADFLMLLDFENEVDSFETQPCTILYKGSEGENRRYTPDVLVHYRNGSQILYEVKHRGDLFENWKKLKPKFKAAIQYAKANNMKFKIITEKEVRTTYLSNLKFLARYIRHGSTDIGNAELIKNKLKLLKSSTPNELIQSLCLSKINQGKMLYNLWSLVALSIMNIECIGIDLTIPITMNSRIWWTYDE